MINKIRNIVAGWGRKLKFIVTTPIEKQLSIFRLAICVKCTESKPSKLLRILNGKELYEDSLLCTKCSCPCLEKTLVTKEKCPLRKW